MFPYEALTLVRPGPSGCCSSHHFPRLRVKPLSHWTQNTKSPLTPANIWLLSSVGEELARRPMALQPSQVFIGSRGRPAGTSCFFASSAICRGLRLGGGGTGATGAFVSPVMMKRSSFSSYAAARFVLLCTTCGQMSRQNTHKDRYPRNTEARVWGGWGEGTVSLLVPAALKVPRTNFWNH